MVKKKEREKRKGKKIRLEEYVKGAQDQQDCEEDDWQKQQLALEGIASIRTKRKVSKRQTFIKSEYGSPIYIESVDNLV